MELAVKRLKQNNKVSLHNRLKILRFMDYLGTRGVSPPRRIRYLIELNRLASMLPTDFERATKNDIEKAILQHGRLDVSENTKADKVRQLDLWVEPSGSYALIRFRS